jgi:hypothetical protein
VANSSGEIWLYDKKGKTLKGWNPMHTRQEIVSSPRHLRVGGKDYFGVLSARGVISLFNRRGEKVPGFPVVTQPIATGEIYANDQSIVLVSEDGHLTRVAADGKMIDDEILLKNDPSSKFRLCLNQDRSDFIVYRIERGQLGFFGHDGKLIFEIPNPVSEKVLLKFITIDKKRSVLLVYDGEQQIAYLVDIAGRILTPQPILSTVIPSVSYSRAKNEINFSFSGESGVKSGRIPY